MTGKPWTWMFGADATSHSVRRRLQVLTLVSGAVLGLAACSSGSSGSPSRQIKPTAAAFSGTGNMSTPAFTVADGWEIQWTTEGNRFQVAARGAENLVVVVKRTEPGGGSTFPQGRGTFRLQVSAKGPWTITVINHSSK
jgi:hypothetical protein